MMRLWRLLLQAMKLWPLQLLLLLLSSSLSEPLGAVDDTHDEDEDNDDDGTHEEGDDGRLKSVLKWWNSLAIAES
jgi:hypothetical protein